MFPALDISSSGLAAQRIRMNARSSNIANVSTTHNEAGERDPYRAKYVIFQTEPDIGAYGAEGVKVSSVEQEDKEPRWKYEPTNPDAIQEGPKAGYVAYPNVDMVIEFTDALEAARSYEANLGAIEITKDMTNQTLRILA